MITLQSVLSMFLLLWKDTDHKELEEKRAYFTMQITVHYDRSHERNLRRNLETGLKQSHGGTLVTGFLFMACSDCFHIQPRTTCSVVASSTVGLTIPHQSPDFNFLLTHVFAHTYTHIPSGTTNRWEQTFTDITCIQIKIKI